MIKDNQNLQKELFNNNGNSNGIKNGINSGIKNGINNGIKNDINNNIKNIINIKHYYIWSKKR